MRSIPIVCLLGACTVGEAGPAAPGSPAATDLAEVQAIADEAGQIERLAAELQARVDESRRNVDENWSEPDDEIEQMRALADEIRRKNDDLQARMKALEERIHEQAGDPAWPPEPLKRR